MFFSEANLNTLDSSQWAGPKATLKKKQQKDGDTMFPHMYCMQTMLVDGLHLFQTYSTCKDQIPL